jgi:hypothetical protein
MKKEISSVKDTLRNFIHSRINSSSFTFHYLPVNSFPNDVGDAWRVGCGVEKNFGGYNVA